MSSFFICIIITIFFNLLIIIKSDDIQCNTAYRECFNCSVCGEEANCNCHWDSTSKGCNPGDDVDLSKDFYLYFGSCTDSDSMEITKKYCGETTLKLNDNDEIDINLPKNDEIYGTSKLFCEYTYSEADDIDIYYTIQYEIEDSKNINSMHVYLDMQFNDDTKTNGYLTYKSFKKDFNNIKRIKVLLYFSKGLSSLPFKLKIIRIGEKSKFALYLAISFIICGCLLCALIIYFLSKRMNQKARMRQRTLIRLAMARQIGRRTSGEDVASSNSVDVEEENRKKIEILLKTSLAPKSYIKEYGKKDGSICTICIEDFKEKKSKVSITPCNHVFHYKCLSNWLIKNVINPKCPNCNYNLVQDIDNKKIEEIQTINVARRTEDENIVSRNIQDNNDNLNTNDNLVYTRNMRGRYRSRLSHNHYDTFRIENAGGDTNEIQEVNIQNN